jgi:hypothetical protein
MLTLDHTPPAASAIAATAAPTVPGTPYAGGFYAGRLRIDGVLHALVVAPKAGGELRGAWHPEYTDVPGACSASDGLANTRAMAAAGSPIAQQALACRVGGFDDWHIPARDALEIMYRHLKPTAEANWATCGDEAFAPRWHWSSTQLSAHDAYTQHFSDGYTDASSKDWSEGVVRLARLIPLQTSTLQPLRREAPSEFFVDRPLTIDAQDLRDSLRFAAEREAGLAALAALSRRRSISKALAHGCNWGRSALEEVIKERVQMICDAGGLLHYGARGVAA